MAPKSSICRTRHAYCARWPTADQPSQPVTEHENVTIHDCPSTHALSLQATVANLLDSVFRASVHFLDVVFSSSTFSFDFYCLHLASTSHRGLNSSFPSRHLAHAPCRGHPSLMRSTRSYRNSHILRTSPWWWKGPSDCDYLQHRRAEEWLARLAEASQR